MKPLPSAKQLQFLSWEFGIFFHFGIRTFYPGHRDWDGVEMPASGFCPTELSCEQWIRAAKEAGATYAILTAKHHDGFALWPTAYSGYSVADSPFRGGRGDVVREFTEACRRYGLKTGLYYSPAQWGSHAIPFANGEEYDTYFIQQLGELLTGYGKIDYLWFDGCGSEGHVYNRKRIVSEIYRMQPEILTFCDPEWTPGVRWIGNEDGYASLENPLAVSETDFSELAAEKETLSNRIFLPGECDCKIRNTWFWDENEETLKSTEELFGMYEMSVGHGSNFLLNIGPDRRGLLPEADMARLHALGERIRTSYGNPLPYTAPERQGDCYTIRHREADSAEWAYPDPGRLSNCIAVEEDLADGASVTSFRVYGYLPTYKEKKILLFCGRTVGHRVYCRFSPIRCPQFEVEITGHEGAYRLRDIRAYYVP